ncbi:MAG TPA: YicC/YloC family endoribonuclease [Candidatus Polarisedimenticolaceae bacterium]|nr:YicC/YloC family endoribonuclease [Candidatus Polarisedimenticolaceae bacterium]
MIRSMTGYGLGTAEMGGLKVTIELRTVNNRFADLKLRLPDELLPFEPELRRRVLATVKRGRLELDLRFDRAGAVGAPVVLDKAVVEAALAAAAELRDGYGVRGEWDLATLLRVPGILVPAGRPREIDDASRAAIERALDGALAALDRERVREGESLAADLRARVDRMEAHVGAVRAKAEVFPAAVHKRILERVAPLVAQVPLDPARVAQEAAFLADRADVTEELVRLTGHLAQARALLAGGDEPVGKRLDFLLQEINRETNTIASKSGDLAISRLALELKSECEKFREQIQNIE